MDILRLNKIYDSVDSIESDINVCKDLTHKIFSIVNKSVLDIYDIENFLSLSNQFLLLYNQLSAYFQLNIYVNTKNTYKYNDLQNKLIYIYKDFSLCLNYFAKSNLKNNLNVLSQKSAIISEHINYIKNIRKNYKFISTFNADAMLSENIYSKMISNLNVFYKNQNYSLTEIDKKILDSKKENERENLYLLKEKQLATIEDKMAIHLINIKQATLHNSKEKMYDSPLDMVLDNIHLDKKILNNLIQSMQKYLPIFHQYLNVKAFKLNNFDGLKYYNLYTPIIDIPISKYSISTVQETLITIFNKYSCQLGDLAFNSFNNKFIDYENRPDKALTSCHIKILKLKESRIICHEKNNIKDLFEIGHEIGHAYHASCIMQTESALNSDIPLHLSEICSLFCELLIYNDLLEKASNNEKIYLLDMFLAYATQSIVEIYSRYLFEMNLFDIIENNKEISSKEISNLMKNSQIISFNKSLNSAFIDKYLWIYKPHFYSIDNCFYNFPYALGLLYAINLFNIYKHSDSIKFNKNFYNFLCLSGKENINELSKIFEINIFLKV